MARAGHVLHCGRRTIYGHAWRKTRSTENVARDVKQALGYFQQIERDFFDDDNFKHPQGPE